MKAEIFGDQGFSTKLHLDQVELGILRGFVRAQYNEIMGRFRDLPMEQYHTLSHKNLFVKKGRILSHVYVKTMRGMKFMRELEREFGPFKITNEENERPEEVYWRIVRPNEPADIGTLHADRWFWDLGHGRAPGTTRAKVWIPLFCEPGVSGLAVVPGSHRREFKYHGEKGSDPRASYQRPVIDEQLDAQVVLTEPGQAVVFHDSLIHGGVNAGATKTRVSLEMMIYA